MKEIKNDLKLTSEELQKQGLLLPKNVADTVYNTLINYEKNKVITFPKNYSVGNALKSAWLKFQNDEKLMSCSDLSKANALLDMAVLGLNPAKTQCYFVPMGNKATLLPSYFGKQCAVKRIAGIIDVKSDVIYKGTEYELTVDDFGNDNITIVSPCPLEERKNENIIGAWAKIILDEKIWNAKEYTSIMTMEDVVNCWKMGNAKGSSLAHNSFKNEMSKKSAINRVIKNFVNTRDDQDIFIETLNRTISNDYIDDEYHNDELFEEKVIDIDSINVVTNDIKDETNTVVEPKFNEHDTLFIK